jgi:HK97 family phage portal protein
MGFLDIFRPLRTLREARWKELGAYSAQFFPFGSDMYQSDLIRSCIRTLAEHTSKANAVSTDERIERLLDLSPNMYMNGKDFLYKVRTLLELKNTAFIYIERDDRAKVKGFYPVPYSAYEGIDYNGRLYIKFYFDGDAVRDLVLPWDDLAVLRKDYNKRDIGGDDNSPIISTLELINTTNQGLANAVKATANLRGILKSTKAMLSKEDIKKQKDQFVADYMNLNNEGGIASLDATQEFTPITMSPIVTNAATLKGLREDVFRYFGVNDSIIMSNYTEEQMEAFYESRIEPFLVALGTELTRKVFTEREIGFDNGIIYESNRMSYASTKTKLAMVSLVDRGALTPNEWRRMFNLAPVEGGDVPIRRLDTQPTDEEPASKEEEKDE